MDVYLRISAGELWQKKLMVAGFEKVFDTDLGADITIIEEATEFIKRFKENKELPLITTCCPAWIKFGEQFFHRLLGNSGFFRELVFDL